MTRDWNSLPDATPDATVCPDCGAPIRGGQRACRALYHEINSRLQAGTNRTGRLLVDSYALQHLDPYCRTAKELIYHIASLCCGLEFGGGPAIYAALHRRIEGQVHADRPAPPMKLGDLTILSVASAGNDGECIDTWARSVWKAYADLQGLGREWVERATRT